MEISGAGTENWARHGGLLIVFAPHKVGQIFSPETILQEFLGRRVTQKPPESYFSPHSLAA